MGKNIYFRHRPSKYLTNLSEVTKIYIEALYILGRNYIDKNTINILRGRIPLEAKETLLKESIGASDWIYSAVREVCKEI